MKIIVPATIDDTTLAYSNVPDTTPLFDLSAIYSLGQTVRDPASKHVYESLTGSAPAVVTISVATPAVVTQAGHGLENGTIVALTTTGALPDGVTEATRYYVVNKTTDTYQLALAPGGAAIASSGDQSGTHHAVAAPNLGYPLSDASKWLDLGPSNRWAMFDDKAGTITRMADTINVSVRPSGRNTALPLFGLAGHSVQAIVTDAVDGEIYNRTFSLVSNDNVADYYDYFFADLIRETEKLIDDLPLYSGTEVNLIIDNTGGMAECGAMQLGVPHDMGVAVLGSGFGIYDYSKKDRGEFGVNLVERGYSAVMRLNVAVPRLLVDELGRILTEGRGRTWAYVGASEYGRLMVLGFPRDWFVTIEHPDLSELTIELESLTYG